MKVLAGGCFNKIHPGHIYFLKKAKSFGYLTVVIANDINNKKIYAIPAKKRKHLLRSLGIADKIITGHPTDFMKTVKKVRPDIIVLGYDQKLDKGLKEKLSKRIKIKRIKKYGSYSSS